MWLLLDIGDEKGAKNSLDVKRYTLMNNWQEKFLEDDQHLILNPDYIAEKDVF